MLAYRIVLYKLLLLHLFVLNHCSFCLELLNASVLFKQILSFYPSLKYNLKNIYYLPLLAQDNRDFTS